MKIKNQFRKLKNLQMQMLVVLLLICILPLFLYAVRLIYVHKSNEQEGQYTAAEEICLDLGTRIQRASYFSTSSQPELSAAIDMAARIFEGRVLVVNSELLVVKDTYDGREEGKTMISEEVISALRGKENIYRNDSSQTVEIVYPIRDSQKETVSGAIVFIYSEEAVRAQIEELNRSAVLSALVLIVIAIALALLCSARLVYPFKQMAVDMQKSADGYWEENLRTRGCYEAECIAESINSMMEDMRDTEKRRQEFVSNVSHELKTPLASMKVLADSLLTEQNATPELYREFLTDINNEINRETQIITDLLNLVKLDRKEGEMQIAQVSINELLDIVLHRLRPLAKQKDVEMIFESYRSVLAEVDEVKMSLIFTNLIENAIKYNRDGGKVKVSLDADPKCFYVKIEDTGIGIPEDAKKYIFDRFYRVDKARSRESGGTGLGLAITKSAVMMHKGSIKVSGKEGEGSVFIVKIPLSFLPNYPAS